MTYKKRKRGVRGTKISKRTVGDKRISSRDTGIKGRSRRNSSSMSISREKNSSRNTGSSIEQANRLLTKLSPKGKANFLKFQSYLAESSKYVSSEEFAGKGLLVEILGIEKRKKGKFGPGFTISLLDCKLNKQRIWNTNSMGALRAIINVIKQGFERMQIWKIGRDQDTRYYAKGIEAATQRADVRTKVLQRKRRKAKR